VIDQLHALAALPSGETASPTHCVRVFVGPTAGLDFMLFLGIETPTVQPIARRYAHWAIPALYDLMYFYLVSDLAQQEDLIVQPPV
jgi:hypothetical protein